MNIHRFVADNSRNALRQVRDQLGGDAIILSNRSVDGGVEIVAAPASAVEALTKKPADVAKPAPVVAKAEAAAPRADASSTDASHAHRGRLASIFARKPAKATPATAIPKAAPHRVDAYAESFAERLADATGVDAGDDFVTRIAPEAVALSKPEASKGQASKPEVPKLEERKPEERKPEASALAVASDDALVELTFDHVVNKTAASAVRTDDEAPIASAAPVFSIDDLHEVVRREVSEEVSREIAREVTSHLARDVTNMAATLNADVTRRFETLTAELNEKLATVTWTEAMRRQPGRTRLMQELILAGFSPALSRHVQERLPDDFSNDEARTWAESVLARNLPVAGDAESLLDEGGVYALVGPTGVGKTTTVAKLAARFALRHGVDKLALITTDGFRIGAQDQLRIYGKILGIPVHSIHDQASLTSAIGQFAGKKLVLIDTAGLGPRDERVAEQIAMLRGAKAKRLVVLNATVDAETLDHVVRTFGDREFAGCVVSKVDEAVRLGPVLDAVIRHRLKVHHVSTGQRVPEDLEAPDAQGLVAQALAARAKPREAFTVVAEDEPVWMSAMVERAHALETNLIADVPANVVANVQASGAVHA